MTVLFKTIHGSRLYGLHHDASDHDYYTVVTKLPQQRARYARQHIGPDGDSVTVDIGTWLMQCEKGVPQALEAMFSRQPIVDNIEALRAGYRVGTGVLDTYLRTIDSFARANDAKRRRHAVRLAINCAQLRACGRMDPTLDQELRDYVHRLERVYPGETLGELARQIAFEV